MRGSFYREAAGNRHAKPRLDDCSDELASSLSTLASISDATDIVIALASARI